MNKVTEGKQCSATIFGERGQHSQCSKKAIVERDGKWYCKIDDPEYIKEKRRKWDEKFDKDSAERKARWAQKKDYDDLASVAVTACKAINPENPQAVAEGIEELVKSCRLFICNINFVKTAEETSQNLLNVLKADIDKALAQVEKK